MQFCLCTGFEESKDCLDGRIQFQLTGYGQGDSAALSIFLCLSILIVNVYKRAGHRAKLISSHICWLFFLPATMYVDSTNLLYWGDLSIQKMRTESLLCKFTVLVSRNFIFQQEISQDHNYLEGILMIHPLGGPYHFQRVYKKHFSAQTLKVLAQTAVMLLSIPSQEMLEPSGSEGGLRSHDNATILRLRFIFYFRLILILARLP